ncbi:MAG: hypothetical protein JEY94_04120 [Melioribacteraceae bacterium]|nr:hypothetical protein [Melioribacteraceae bacterium]
MNMLKNMLPNKKLNLFFILLANCFLLTANSSLSYAQSLSEDLNSDVYDYLSNLSVKGVIEFRDVIKPVGRKYIAEKLNELDTKKQNLTNIEKDELEFYKKEFGQEIEARKKLEVRSKKEKEESSLTLFNMDEFGRYRLFSFRNDLFKVTVDPIFGYDSRFRDGGKTTHFWNGISMNGYLDKNWSFYFKFTDNSESGEFIDYTRTFSRDIGYSWASSKSLNSLVYDISDAELNYSWSWGTIGFNKTSMTIGSSKQNQLILSSKPPSFEKVWLQIKPANWLELNYFHGWLHSNLKDSLTHRITPVEGRPSFDRIGKYIVNHSLSVYPNDKLSITLGESIIYSDKLEFAYFIPVLFFRVTDHYLSDETRTDSGDNAQLFADINYKITELNTEIYSTLYIDEMSINGVIEGDNTKPNTIGFSIGFANYDLVPNGSMVFEYTRLNPFMYMNSDDAHLYQNKGYSIGSWIGSNGDQIYFSYTQRFLRGLKLEFWGEYIRKGKKEDPEAQYQVPYPAFLHGLNVNYTNYGVDLKYEITHKLFARSKFQYSKITTEQETGGFVDETYNEFSFAIYYGL